MDLDNLRNGVERWNIWRRENPEVSPDLAGANLVGADLSGADLSRANLSRANLKDAKLASSNLSGAELVGTQLTLSDLGQADLSNANLETANLAACTLVRANLEAANLVRAYMVDVQAEQASFRAANLSWANISGSDFNECDLTRAILNDTIIRGVKMNSARLVSVDLRNATFVQVTLRNADLSECSLIETVLGNCDFADAVGLDTCRHFGPSIVDIRTLDSFEKLPVTFLRGCGVPENLIHYLPSLLNRPIEFYSCFISYSHEDRAFARRLSDALQSRGIRCWLDEHQLLPGDDIYDQVDRGIRLWDKVLLCCSEHSLRSWWVEAEITQAFRKEEALAKERGRKLFTLIPLNLDGYLFDGWDSGVATRLRARMAADFRGWETDSSKTEEQIEKVIRALRSDESARERSPMTRF